MMSSVSSTQGVAMWKQALFLGASIVLSVSGASAQATVSSCNPADRVGKGLRKDFANIVSDSTNKQASRRELYQLPSADDSAVVQILDDALCATAVNVFTANGARPPKSIYLYRVNDVYIAVRRYTPNSEFESVAVLDSTLTHVLKSVAR
jgi:hypothetical protein